MIVIFWLSSRTSEQSSEQSDYILGWLTEIFGENIFTVFIVRKSAHCLEYTGLSLLINATLYFFNNKKMLLLGVAITSIYAVTDELHQLFVEGRSCQISDWAIDTLGAIFGAIAFFAIYLIIKTIIKSKSKKFIDTRNN